MMRNDTTLVIPNRAESPVRNLFFPSRKPPYGLAFATAILLASTSIAR
jgi:hypothetical protein